MEKKKKKKKKKLEPVESLFLSSHRLLFLCWVVDIIGYTWLSIHTGLGISEIETKKILEISGT